MDELADKTNFWRSCQHRRDAATGIDEDSISSIMAIMEATHIGESLYEMLDRAFDSILEYTNFSAAALFVKRDAGLELLLQRHFTLEAIEHALILDPSGSITGTTVNEDRIVVADATDKRIVEAIRETMATQNRQSIISIPLRNKGLPIGAMNLVFNDKWESSPGVENALLLMGSIIATPLENMRQRVSLESAIREKDIEIGTLKRTLNEAIISKENMELNMHESMLDLKRKLKNASPNLQK